MTLIKKRGRAASGLFDQIITKAYGKVIDGKGGKDEPHFVNELISRRTIRYLNHAAAKVYDPNYNSVRFFSGFIHNHPLVKFDAVDGRNSRKDCKVELGDILLVRVLTQPNNSGKHVVTSKRGLLVQAKKSAARKPSLLRSLVGTHGFLDTNDREQLFLYKTWPKFDLMSGHNSLGCFDIKVKHNSSDFPLGKYGILRDPKTKNAFSLGVEVLSLNPYERNKNAITFGRLLEGLIDGAASAGADYKESVLLPGSMGGWDELMTSLLEFCETAVYSTSPRLRDPAMLKFSTFVSKLVPAAATVTQELSFMGYSTTEAWKYINRFLHPSFRGDDTRPDHGMPVLIVGVSSSQRFDESVEVELPETGDVFIRALLDIMDIQKWKNP